MAVDKSITRRRVDAAALDLKGTTAAVVGGTGGLGRAIARTLADRGARVIVVGQTIRDDGVQGIEFLRADLASMREAARVGEALPDEGAIEEFAYLMAGT